MTMIPNMCDRHFLLILTVLHITSKMEGSVSQSQIYDEFYGEVSGDQRTREFWDIRKGAHRELYSKKIEEDLALLHQHGCLYVDVDAGTADPRVTLTDKGHNAVSRFIVDTIHAIAPKEEPTPFP